MRAVFTVDYFGAEVQAYRRTSDSFMVTHYDGKRIHGNAQYFSPVSLKIRRAVRKDDSPDSPEGLLYSVLLGAES
jgi:hypothetical protein